MGNKIYTVGSKTTKRGSTFADLGLKRGKPIGKSVDIHAIRGALHNIFSWKPGERILDPAFGNGLYRTLFEPMSTELHDRQVNILRTMFSYEPRVKIETLDVIPDALNQSVHIVVSYSIPKLGVAEIYEQTVAAQGN